MTTPRTPATSSIGPRNSSSPLLLLPVSIQTRFIDGIRGSELWVRIYPDQIAVNSHEPELTAAELSDGRAYWNAVWLAGNPPPNPDDAKAPWRTLASRYNPQRAAWIAFQLTPINSGVQPSAPVSPGATPVPLPVFPIVPSRDSSWEQPALADALPDAWTVVLISGASTSLHRSSPIVTPLAISLTPNGTGFPTGDVVDAGLKWIVDFPTAVAAGMGLGIPLTPEQRASGFDQIFVYGLRASDVNPGQKWADLLTAHHYTDGLSFLPQGSPTNNTPDATSAYSRKDPDSEISFQTERGAALTGNPDADGPRFASLTGIPSAWFDHVRYADGTGALNATDMLTALWPATMGYFLSQMMAEVFTPEFIEEARQYAIANMRSRGPLASFRTGTTPYGILPVTSLFNYHVDPEEAGEVEAGVVDFVRQLWPIWLAASSAAPHMQRGGDPDQNLMSVLGMDASSMNFQGRAVLGNTFLWNFLNFLGVPAAFQGQWWQDLSLPARELFNNFGRPNWNPKLIGLGFAETSFPVNLSTVQDAPLSETDPLSNDATIGAVKGNYITWLQTAPIADIQAEIYPGPQPTALLYKILRQSILLQYANLAGAQEVFAGRLLLERIRENELVAMEPAPVTLTPWQLLARPSIPNPHLIWADYLLTTNFAATSPFAQLNDFRASLSRLASLPTAELDRLLTETLDAGSHRLDVWTTGIATSLLSRTRAAGDNSIGLGCYGWLEDVRPEAQRALVQGNELEAVRTLDALRSQRNPNAAALPVPLQPLTDNGGFIYAPSPTHAAVAAVLRNGYMTHKNTGQEGLLSVDLSSERVNRALTLLEGVQEGQSLNALLGYLFEDALSSLGLETYIQAFRQVFPVVGNKLTPSSAPAESVAASNVVDGLTLRNAWDSGLLLDAGPWGPGLPAPGPEQDAIVGVFKMLDDAADALGDLSLSEAVFQIVRGNFGRGGGLMDAISRGSRPPDPDVVDTPSGGIDLTHRLTLLFASAVSPSAKWSGIPQHPRASAEPSLDAWLSHVLPDPAKVRCQVSFLDAANTAHIVTVALSDLQAGPLDVLSMSDAAETPQRSELENRILFAASLPAGAQQVQIIFAPADLPHGSLLFPDALYVAQTLRTFIGACRALDPQDMTAPETDAASTGGAIDLVDLRARAAATLSSLTNNLTALIAASNPDAIRAALFACSFYGVPGSIPNSSVGVDPVLLQQQTAVAAALQGRVAQASKVTIATAGVPDLQGLLQTIFGSDFMLVPRFTPPSVSRLHDAFSQSSSLVASDPQAPARWLRQATYTHPGASRFDLALSAAQAIGDGAFYPPALSLAQVPPPQTLPDRWLALPLDPSNPPQKGRVALACVASGDPVTASTYAGLLIEEWPERIPGNNGSSAVAFHFEEPSARAPNVVLLAVCPKPEEGWDDPMLQAVLAETLQLAKIRTVDLATVGTVGQVLPALYFALNLQGATISTRFAYFEEAILANRNPS